MKKELKKMNVTAIALALFGVGLLSSHAVWADGRPSLVIVQAARTEVVLDADASRILAVLESGLQGRALPEQAESKLSVMDQNRIRLLSELSDRVLDRDHPTGSRIALFLMTMLIILS
jgi:hypothetical protein